MCGFSLLLVGIGWEEAVPAETEGESERLESPELAGEEGIIQGPSSSDDAVEERRETRSVGHVNMGHLEGGVHVQPTEHLRFVTNYLARGYFFGTLALVELVEGGAEEVAKAVTPAARLAVGELSAPEGGRISIHRSHQNGRDVDLGFYVVDDEGQPVEVDELLKFRWSPTVAHEGRRLHFDVHRNWRLVQYWLTSSIADVQYIFVSRFLKSLLLAEARRQGASEELLDRADRVLMQPPRAAPHDDHFHIRIYCPEDDLPVCRDRSPIWPWAQPSEAPAAAFSGPGA